MKLFFLESIPFLQKHLGSLSTAVRDIGIIFDSDFSFKKEVICCYICFYQSRSKTQVFSLSVWTWEGHPCFYFISDYCTSLYSVSLHITLLLGARTKGSCLAFLLNFDWSLISHEFFFFQPLFEISRWMKTTTMKH